MSDRVLVTGAAGFIASHCILALFEQGYRVRGTMRDPARAGALKAALAKHHPGAADLEVVAADLTNDRGWAEAVADCRYVLHVASPNPLKYPKDRDAFVAPARDGTLRVLRAAVAASVSRVVMTSSIAAIAYGREPPDPPELTEADWSNPDAADNNAYTRSKTLAERAAWDFVAGEGKALELAVVNPGLVLGPVLEQDFGSSAEVVRQILARKVPGYPRVGFSTVDVRDVASLHLLAMTSPAARGERFIASSEYMWMEDVGAVLRERYPGRGIPKRKLPDFLLKALALVNGPVKVIVPELQRRRNLGHEKATRVLGWRPRSGREAVLETARTLIELGIV